MKEIIDQKMNKEFEFLLTLILIIGIISFSGIIYCINFTKPVASYGVENISMIFQRAMSDTNTPLKMIVNGRLGFLLAFCYEGNINWLSVVAGVIYLVIFRKSIVRWQLALVTMLVLLSFIFSSFGYYNPRYGFTISPILSFITIFCSWQIFSYFKFFYARKLFMGFLVFYVFANNFIFVFIDPVHMRKAELANELVWENKTSAYNYDAEISTAVLNTAPDTLAFFYREYLKKNNLETGLGTTKEASISTESTSGSKTDLSPLAKHFSDELSSLTLEELDLLNSQYSSKIKKSNTGSENNLHINLEIFQKPKVETLDSNVTKARLIKSISDKQMNVYSFLKSGIYKRKKLLNNFVLKKDNLFDAAENLIPFSKDSLTSLNTAKDSVKQKTSKFVKINKPQRPRLGDKLKNDNFMLKSKHHKAKDSDKINISKQKIENLKEDIDDDSSVILSQNIIKNSEEQAVDGIKNLPADITNHKKSKIHDEKIIIHDTSTEKSIATAHQKIRAKSLNNPEIFAEPYHEYNENNLNDNATQKKQSLPSSKNEHIDFVSKAGILGRIINFFQELFAQMSKSFTVLLKVTIENRQDDFFNYINKNINLKPDEAIYVERISKFWYYTDKRAFFGISSGFFGKDGQQNLFNSQTYNNMDNMANYMKDTLKLPYIVTSDYSMNFYPKLNEFISSKCILIDKSKDNTLFLFKIL